LATLQKVSFEPQVPASPHLYCLPENLMDLCECALITVA
jgi:hypothetical protein